MSDYVEVDGALVHKTANLVGKDIKLGEGTRVDAFVTLTGRIRIGRQCHIGVGACVFGGAGFLMGDYASMSAGAKVFTGTEDLGGEWCTNPCAYPRNPSLREIVMGDHATIGANSILLPGAFMPEGSVLGANSMTKRPLTEWSIWAGNPAAWVKSRSRGIPKKLSQQRTGVSG